MHRTRRFRLAPVLLAALVAAACRSAAPSVEEARDPTNSTLSAEGLEGRLICGYQGWFAAPGDGSGRGFVHWGPGEVEPGRCSVDLWPDLEGFDPDERFPTGFRHRDGRVAEVFSSLHPKTVDRHFRLMREHGLDGVALQRFASELRSPKARAHRDRVLDLVRLSAARHGRLWFPMYDLSGLGRGEVVEVVGEDLSDLLARGVLGADDRHLRLGGRPLVGVWGVGFSDGRQYGLEEIAALLDIARDRGLAVLLGLPTFWRTLDRDAIADPRLLEICARADVLSPWTVGRFTNDAEARSWAETTAAGDLAWCRERGLRYLPVIFPGFSWRNLSAQAGREAPLDQIPRRGGRFLAAQATALHDIGVRSLYLAMFDEFDEGTAILPFSADPPVEGDFVARGALPPDHDLRLAGRIRALLNGGRPRHEPLLAPEPPSAASLEAGAPALSPGPPSRSTRR